MSFHYQPPNLSPSRTLLPNPSSSNHEPYRPGSSSGPGASAAFSATLPSVAEDARPSLAPFGELTGDGDLLEPPASSHGLDRLGGAQGGLFGSHEVNGGQFGGGGIGAGAAGAFRDPFAPNTAPAPDAAAEQSWGAPPALPSHNAMYFNPQTVHPSVNSRNTRPLTAPTHYSAAYSATPSSFYTPAQSATGSYDPLQLATQPGQPPSTAGSSFQYQVDSNPNVDYDNYRGRIFSLPDTVGGSDGPISAGGASGSGEDASPTGSHPFFYAPPPSLGQQQHQPTVLRPVTAGGGYYPAVIDPTQPALVHPLVPSVLPPPPGSVGGLQQQVIRRRSSGGASVGAAGNKSFNFVQQAGAQTKRPRRRYDEIERLYNCDYPGCTKAYGTLNHLNSHKTMQKHGPKSTPAQFKEMRKAWRERKKAEAAAAARNRPAQDPHSVTASGTHEYHHPNSAYGMPSVHERPRPSTSAGEYHYTMAAPFMTPVGAPVVPAYAHQPQAASTSSYTLPQQNTLYTAPDPNQPFYAPTASTSTAAIAAPGVDLYGTSSSGLRPFTAPSYYLTPSFGGAGNPAAPAGTSFTLPSSATAHLPPGPNAAASFQQYPRPAGYSNPQSLAGATSATERRFSLPSSSLAGTVYSAPSLPGPAPLAGASTSPDSLKMPQPVLGYQNHGHVALLGSSSSSATGQGGPTGARAPAAAIGSLGISTNGGGAAKLVLGGGEGEGAAGGAGAPENGYGGGQAGDQGGATNGAP